MNQQYEKAIAVGVQLPSMNDEKFYHSLEELKSLTHTAGGEVVLTVTQKRQRFDMGTYIGEGKVDELVAYAEEFQPDIIIFNNELSPSQIRNLSNILDARVIDRTQLILDIFAQRARSKEGKLQVELAQLQYMLPRLVGQGTAMSRLGAGIGTRGPGETKLETDRRHIRNRIADIKTQLKNVASHRARYREKRKSNAWFTLALVGYTNAGKSTLFNRLTAGDSFEENLLFATLDPLTKKTKLPSGLEVLVSDTVGFIQDLPTTLVAAFRSTLEEAKEADALLIVVDASDPHYKEQEATVHKVLNDLDIEGMPVFTIYNKMDAAVPFFAPAPESENVQVSARSPKSREQALQFMEKQLKELFESYHVVCGPAEGQFLDQLRQNSIVSNLYFNENAENYEVKGYVQTTSALYGKIQKRNENGEL